MTNHLESWPIDSAPAKDGLITRCDDALALVRVASNYGQKNGSFLKDTLDLLQKQLNEIDHAIGNLVTQLERLESIPFWIMDIFKLRPKKTVNLIDFMAVNRNAIKFIREQNDPAKQKKALALMRDNFKEMIFCLQGKRWSGKALPPKN